MAFFGSLVLDRVLCSSTLWNLGPICLVRSQGAKAVLGLHRGAD